MTVDDAIASVFCGKSIDLNTDIFQSPRSLRIAERGLPASHRFVK